MRIDILTLFPGMFSSPFDYSIIKRAKEKKLVEILLHDLRDWSTDSYKTVDDRPYGGGPGMILKVDLVDRAVKDIKKHAKTKIILTDPAGKRLNQNKAKELSVFEQLIIICGHYEGVDHRVAQHIADEVISVGDYVLSGGEIPAMAITDAVVRLIPSVLGNPHSLDLESHDEDQTEYPQYTRPESYNDWVVPAVLLSGNHKNIEEWKRKNKK